MRQVHWGDDKPLLETGAAPGAEIEMGALGADEAPFGANVSRVLKVGKKFAPKVVARMEQMSSDAIKK